MNIGSVFKKAPEKSSLFRQDIAGIRGIAVMMVTLCHFGIPGFAGGFIGPDIFFVLSGYLITGIIYREYTSRPTGGRRARKISLKNFYLRRTRRILPAAVAVIIFVNIYAKFFLKADQVTQIRTDSIWTLLFGANINFMRQATDYFAQSLSVSPLQHYWSLSVEEQFYFFWPLLLLWAASFRKMRFFGNSLKLKNRLSLVFAVVSIASLAWMIYSFKVDPTTTYFSTFSRTWELGIGGLIAIMAFNPGTSKFAKLLPVIRIISLVALFAGLFIVTPDNFGFTLVVPVLATAVLLVTTNNEVKPDLISKLLSIRPLTSIGTISYSVYLWHWPVVVFGHQLGFFNNLASSLLGVVVVLALGMAGYYLIERPFMSADWAKLFSTSRLRKRKRKKTPSGKKSKLYTSPFVTGVLVVSVAALLAGAFYANPANGGSANQGWVPPASAQLFAPNATTAANATSSASPASIEVDPVALEAAMADWKGQIESGLKLTQLPTDLNPSITKSLELAKLGGWTACMGQRKDAATISDVCESIPTASAGVKTAVLLGDSHMRIFWETITSSLDLRKWHVVMLGMPSCPVPPLKLKVVSKYNKDCDQHREATFKYVEKSKPDLLFISDAMNSKDGVSAFKAGYDQVVPRLKAATKQLVLFETSAGTARLMDCLDGGTSLTNCKPKIYRVTPLRQAQRDIAQKFGIGYWETGTALCADLGKGPMCPPVIGNMAVSGDGSHIFPSVSRKLAPFLIKTLNELKIKDLAPVG